MSGSTIDSTGFFDCVADMLDEFHMEYGMLSHMLMICFDSTRRGYNKVIKCN